MRIQSGHVYLAPAGFHLLVADEQLRLGNGPRENHARPAIDPLFRSAAASRGSRTIGVVLSGSLDDGASGLETIKRCGGIALVQSPDDARVSEMPVAALDATPVDLSAAPPVLAAAMERFAREDAPPSTPVSKETRLEIEIAAGEAVDNILVEKIAHATTLSCPDCGGVLSSIAKGHPLRFRCQIGHAHTARSVFRRQHAQVHQALQVALRIVQERADLIDRMERDATDAGRPGMAQLYADRSAEYRSHADTIRQAIFELPEDHPTTDTVNLLPNREVLGAEDSFEISESSEN